MAGTEPKPINSLKKGSSVVIDGEPCRVTDISSSKSGKHGHAKFRMEAVGLFDGKKRQLVMPSGHTVEVPMIEKQTAQVLSVSGDTASVMDSETYVTFDLPIPAELKDECKEGSEVLYWEVMDRKVMKQVKS